MRLAQQINHLPGPVSKGHAMNVRPLLNRILQSLEGFLGRSTSQGPKNAVSFLLVLRRRDFPQQLSPVRTRRNLRHLDLPQVDELTTRRRLRWHSFDIRVPSPGRDGSIIIVENIHKKLGEWEDAGRPTDRTEVVIRAMTEVGPSIFFSLLVITVSFLPVFTLQATEGRCARGDTLMSERAV